jgi:hypothetical protein
MYPPYEPSKVRGVLDEEDAGVGWGGVASTVGNVVETEQKPVMNSIATRNTATPPR